MVCPILYLIASNMDPPPDDLRDVSTMLIQPLVYILQNRQHLYSPHGWIEGYIDKDFSQSRTVSDDPDMSFVLQDTSGSPVAADHTSGLSAAILDGGQLPYVEVIIDHRDAQEAGHVRVISRTYRDGE